MANINCSWTSPVKIRKILIGGDKKMIVYDDIEPTEKIRIYDSGYSIRSDADKNNILVDYRIGDIHVPKLDNNEALSLMTEDFIKSIQKKSRPLSNANLGLEVVEILEAAQKSIHLNGSIVRL